MVSGHSLEEVGQDTPLQAPRWPWAQSNCCQGKMSLEVMWGGDRRERGRDRHTQRNRQTDRKTETDRETERHRKRRRSRRGRGRQMETEADRELTETERRKQRDRLRVRKRGKLDGHVEAAGLLEACGF